MRLLWIILIFANQAIVFAYKDQDLPNLKQVRTNSSFQLSVQDSNNGFSPSNIGVVGIRYIHKPYEMSTVIEVYPNTPAAFAGIRVGDRILEVQGVNVAKLTADDVYALIAGRPGELVNIKFSRCSSQYSCATFTTNLRRIDMNSIESDQVFRIYKYSN